MVILIGSLLNKICLIYCPIYLGLFILMINYTYHLHGKLLVTLTLEIFIVFLLFQFVFYFETFFSFDLNFETRLFLVYLHEHLFSSLFLFPCSYVHLDLIIPHYFPYLIPLVYCPLVF